MYPYPIITLVTEGVPEEQVEAGLRVLNRVGGGHTLQEGLVDRVQFMPVQGSIRGGIQFRLPADAVCRVFQVEDGSHEVRVTMGHSRRVCVMDGLTAEELPRAFSVVWNEVADKV